MLAIVKEKQPKHTQLLGCPLQHCSHVKGKRNHPESVAKVCRKKMNTLSHLSYQKQNEKLKKDRKNTQPLQILFSILIHYLTTHNFTVNTTAPLIYTNLIIHVIHALLQNCWQIRPFYFTQFLISPISIAANYYTTFPVCLKCSLMCMLTTCAQNRSLTFLS